MMLFQCISSGFSALQLFLELVKFCLCNPLKLHDVLFPLLAAVHAGHARTQRQGGNSLVFVKRLLPPVLPWQTVEVGLSRCSLFLQKLQVSLSFGVKTPTFSPPCCSTEALQKEAMTAFSLGSAPVGRKRAEGQDPSWKSLSAAFL